MTDRDPVTEQAEAEVVSLLQQTQVQALYGALVSARAEVIRLRAELATRTEETTDDPT